MTTPGARECKLVVSNGAELGPVPERLLEVVTDNLVGLPFPLEPERKTVVQTCPLPFRRRSVGCVVYQCIVTK